MSLQTLRQMAEDFRCAAEPTQATRPVIPVSLEVLRTALEPVQELMINYDAYHDGSGEISVDSLLKYLRQTCLDLQLARTDIDSETIDQQNKLLESLHSVMEDTRQATDGIAMVDYDDIFKFSQLSNVIRDASDICHNEMKRELGDTVSSDLYEMLNKTADRFDAAQSLDWSYKQSDLSVASNDERYDDFDAVAQNDDIYDQPSVA